MKGGSVRYKRQAYILRKRTNTHKNNTAKQKPGRRKYYSNLSTVLRITRGGISQIDYTNNATPAPRKNIRHIWAIWWMGATNREIPGSRIGPHLAQKTERPGIITMSKRTNRRRAPRYDANMGFAWGLKNKTIRLTPLKRLMARATEKRRNNGKMGGMGRAGIPIANRRRITRHRTHIRKEFRRSSKNTKPINATRHW